MTAYNATDDYKAFIVPLHPNHGILLLYCTRKKSKGPHHQLPGGHVDKEDFDRAITMSPGISGVNHLLLACKIGAARELFEETGMDLRTSLDRLKPLQLRSSSGSESDLLTCEFKKRVLFSVDINDDDMFIKGSGFARAMNKNLQHLKLKLSHEHQGFVFEPSIVTATELLTKHSGGKISIALKFAVDRGEIECALPVDTIPDAPLVQHSDEELQGREKEILPRSREKNVFDCFDCWRVK